MSDETSTPKADDGPPRQAWRRWLRRIGLASLALVLLVVLAIVFVLMTSVGTRLALRQGLAFYSDTIPGHIEFARSEGALSQGVTLEGLRVADAAGVPIVEVERIHVGVDLGSALGGVIDVGTIEIDDANIDVGGAFSDLATPAAPEPEPPSPGIGPDLPVALQGTVVLRALQLHDGLINLAKIHRLEADAWAAGTEATLQLRSNAEVSAAELAVYDLSVSAAWDSPVLRVPSLFVATSEGTVRLNETFVDLETTRFHLGATTADLHSKHLAALAPTEPIGTATVSLEGEGTLEAALLDVFVDVPFVGSAGLLLDVGIDDVPWASLLLDVGLQEGPTASSMELPQLSVRLEAEGEGDLDSGVDARVHARCLGCDRDAPIELDAVGRASPGAALVRVDADVNAAALTVHVDAVGSALVGMVAAVSVRVPQLAELAPVIERFAPGLGLRGSVSLDARCGALISPEVAGCRAAGGLDDGAPVQQVAFDISAGVYAQRVAALVHELKLDQDQARVRMGPKPARILVTPQVVAVQDLRASIGTTAGMGAFALEGRLGLGDVKSVEANARLSGLPLHSIRAFVPSLDVRGTLNANLSVGGTLGAPELDATVRGRSLGYTSMRIGNLDASARYLDQSLVTTIDIDDGDLGTVGLNAKVPVEVDVENGRFGLLGRRRSSVDLDVRGARLESTRVASPQLSSLKGEIDVTLSQRGSFARPQLHLEAALRDGAFEGHVLPETGVRVQYDQRIVEASVFASHPEAFDRISLTAVAPLSLNLLRGAATLRGADEMQVDLEVRGAKLAYARRLDDRIEAAGVVSIDATMRGSPSLPTASLTIDADALAWQDQPAGELSAAFAYEADEATARLWASGPEVSGLGIDATVPFTLDLATPANSQWHPDRPHAAQVAINELLVRPVLARIPAAASLDLDGRLHTVLSLAGTATQPKVSVHGELDDIVYGGRAAGAIDLDAEYVQSRAKAEVLWDAPRERTAWVMLDAPVALDLVAGTAKWDQAGEHHVRVSVPKLDPVLVAPFVDAGDLDGAFALHAIADGSLAAFNASLSARGVVRSPGKNLPLDARVVLTPTNQTASVDLGSQVHVQAATKVIVAELLEGGDWRTAEVEATADIDTLRLSDVSGFSPSELQNLRGRLDAHLDVSGRLGEPAFNGSLALADGAVTVVPARVRLTDLALASTFDRSGLRLDRLTLRAAEGSVAAKGVLEVVPNKGLDAKLDLDVKQFPIRAPGLPRMALSTKVDAKAFANLDALDVDIGVGKTLVDVYASSISAADLIPTNTRVVLADLSLPPEAQQPSDSDPAAQADDDGIPKHIAVRLAEDVRIIGPSIDMRWAGNLETTIKGGQSTASGKLNAKKGTFSMLGNDFDLERGAVFLPDGGGAMPFIDVTANTSVEDVVITVAIRGPASRPEFVLSSVPALPQSEIFTVLVTGTADTQGADSEEVQDKAAAVLAAMSNSTLQREIGQKLRVDKIGVGFGDSTDQPILSVGKNVTKNVYAETEYHHNAPQGENTAQLEVEYEFAPRWSLETFFGDAAEGGIAVLWGFAFDTPPKKRN